MNTRSLTSLAKELAQVLVVAAVYYGAARLGLLLAFEKTNASPVWPPSGIAFAAVLLLGYRIWPGIMLVDCSISNVTNCFVLIRIFRGDHGTNL